MVTAILLGVVCVFETPLVVLAAVNLGVLSSRTLRRNRRKGYFIVAAVALALPGPDPVTTALELLPMWLLFEGSIWLAVIAERRAARVNVAGARHDPAGVEAARRLLGGVVLLHVAGFGPVRLLPAEQPALAGLATLAYTFGLRHAFDADHIAAIDNTTRKLLQDGERPLGTGFFFSLGHSTIVFVADRRSRGGLRSR